MEAPTFPPQRKRIRFSYDEPEPDEPRSRYLISSSLCLTLLFPPFPFSSSRSLLLSFPVETLCLHREKKPRFPKGKKEFQKIERGLEFEGEIAAIPSTDPRVAAKERAGRRTVTFSDVEEVSLPADVYDAEEEYQVRNHLSV